MTGTRLYLLGPPRIERDGAPVMVDTAKAIALLAYLVLTEASQRRKKTQETGELQRPYAKASHQGRGMLQKPEKTVVGDPLLPRCMGHNHC